MARRAILFLLLLVCIAGVVGYQATRPRSASGSVRAFVPSARFYLDFSPSFRTTIADAYWLSTVQYYGEHVTGDHRLDALPQMLDLVTRLSPGWAEPYLFGSFALVDAGRADAGYKLLLRGAKARPHDWRVATMLGDFIYTYASNADKARRAATWYQKAAAMPGRPAYVPRLAADLLAKGGEAQKAALLWAQIYGQGDKYARQKAVLALNTILPKDKQARMKAVALLAPVMSRTALSDLVAELFRGY
jgi:hypothetical protein